MNVKRKLEGPPHHPPDAYSALLRTRVSDNTLLVSLLIIDHLATLHWGP